MLRFVFSIAIVWLATLTVTAQPQHDKEFWRTILKQHAAVPEHESADALAGELSATLASPDPEVRDDLAYSILARWINRGNVLSTPTLIALTDEWRANLKSGLGETGTDSVLKRSFSALCLSEMARRESKSPFMGPERYHSLVGDATSYLRQERDLRGYDAKLHWIHATAHTADLLAALGDSPQLSKQEVDSILQAIQSRLSTATEVFTQGEQDRLAIAVVSVIRRKDFDAATFGPWSTRLQDEDRDVWTATTPESLARYQNHNYLLQALTVRILMEPDSPRMADYRQQVVKLLRTR
ncbi:MAG TPA: DUF2785 domain-containing protein [Candidatus Sulfotelmatobacter sp.]|nr:DUF2785 domain-containing protein [Candidatus Sulfotelmatobacter sp.]